MATPKRLFLVNPPNLCKTPKPRTTTGQNSSKKLA
jgi:hypothetical protein